MKLMRVSLAAVLALVGLIGSVAAPARAQSDGNAVTEWNFIAVNTLIAFPGPAGGAPPAAQIHVAMVQGAVYDAVNATEPKHYQPYLLKRRFSAAASQHAAVATAAYGVLSNIITTVPETINFPNRANLLSALSTEYSNHLAAIPDSAFKRQGIAAGTAAATAMIAARQNDGRFGPSQWVPNSAVGHWQPLPGEIDPTPWAGGVRSFLLRSSSQFRTDGPNLLTSSAYAADFNEVKELGSVSSATRTADQTHNARFWQSTPVRTWNEVTRNLVNDPAYDIGLADSARLFAMQNLSAADAAINCWNDKYYWDFWRPVNAIRSLADDGNPATVADPTWTPMFNAPYPDHPSGTSVSTALTWASLRSSSVRTTSRTVLRVPSSRARSAPSIRSRRHSTRSSRHASGPASTSAPPMCRHGHSAGTSPTTWRPTTSSPSATDIQSITGAARRGPRRTVRAPSVHRRLREASGSHASPAVGTDVVGAG